MPDTIVTILAGVLGALTAMALILAVLTVIDFLAWGVESIKQAWRKEHGK